MSPQAPGPIRVLLVVGALAWLAPAASVARADKMMGRFAPQSPDRYRAAHAFLERNAHALGMSPDLADLATAGRSDDAGGTVLRFAQLHHGVPVRDATVLVGFDPRGEIIHVDSGYVPDIDVPTRPRVSKTTAVAAAARALGTRLPASRDVQLVVARGDKAHPGYHLAWEVAAVTQRPPGDWHVFVDGRTGAVIRSLNLLKRAGPVCVAADPASDDAAALVFAHSPIDELDDPTLSNASNVDAALSGCKLDNLTSSTGLTGTYANTSLTAAPRATPPYTSLRSVDERSVDEATAYYQVNRSKEYLNLLGFQGVMDHSVDIDAADPTLGDNSQYISATKQLDFGTGGVDDAQDPDVVDHEVMHAIQDDQIPGFGTTAEAGALGEGTADYWASALTDDAAATLMGSACFGAWDAVSFNPYTGASGSGCVRRVDGSKQFPRDLGFEVHDDGEIYSAALWRLRTVLGGAVVDRLVIKSHTFLQTGAGFLDAADALQSADLALYGGAHATAIDAAMKASGVPRTGSPASAVGLASSAAFSCESQHPYAALSYTECSYTQPGATRLRAHFTAFETEDGVDFVRISDADYRQAQTLSGTPFGPSGDGFSAAVRGDMIVVRFKADPSLNANGFAIDRVESASNSAPTATPDSYTQYGSDTGLTVAAPGVLANDQDDDGDSLTAIKIANPSHGSVTLNANGSFTYQPAENYVGADSFTYKANDGTANSSVVTVRLSVGAGCNGKQATISGTGAANKLTGTAGNDVIAGLGGGDTILSAGGNDTVCAGAGNDTVNAGGGDDYVDGGSGSDSLRGDIGNDTLLGGTGSPDSCQGDTGTDTADSNCEAIKGVP